MTATTRVQMALDRVLAIGLAGLLAGTCLAFGGAAWWAPAAIAALTTLIVLTWLFRSMLSGKFRILKSPLTGLALVTIGLAVFQSIPLPSMIGDLASPRARQVQTFGVLPDVVRADDPASILPDPINGRTPLTLDRSATVRWIAGAMACLALFWVVSHYTDRLERLYLIWGSVVVAFLLNAAIVAVQLVGQVDGIYGFIEPGAGPRWAPNLADAVAGPGETVLRTLGSSKATGTTWALALPGRRQQIGTMMGGSDAFLALSALGLPLAMAMTLQIMAPRGSREGFWTRLAHSGQGSLLVLLYLLTVLSGTLVGLFAGRFLAIPYLLSIGLIGLASLFGTGLRFKGLFFTFLCLATIVGGVVLGDHWTTLLPTAKPLPRVDLTRAQAVWSDSLPMLKDFTLLGTGFGSYSSIQPFYKTRDTASTTAMSSVLQWWVESGVVGLGLLALAVIWAIVSLPGAFRRVGSADRALVFGLIGTLICFAMVSTLHWTIELMAVALAASAVAGTCNRWLAGGTDLFVERS